MSEDELFFDFNDEITNPPSESPKRKRRAGSRSVTSSIAIKEHTDGWRLHTVGDCGVLPAGSRLFRKEPWPIDRFIFDTEEEAREAAEALAAYLGTTCAVNARGA